MRDKLDSVNTSNSEQMYQPKHHILMFISSWWIYLKRPFILGTQTLPTQHFFRSPYKIRNELNEYSICTVIMTATYFPAKAFKICDQYFPAGSTQTGVKSFFPGTSRSSITRCKSGANCPSSHSGISRQLSPLSVTEDSSAPILELQSRGSSGVCGHRIERQSRAGRLVTSS